MTQNKKDPRRRVTEQLPFYPDLSQEQQAPFYCSYSGDTILGDDPKKQYPVYILTDVETGEQVFCMQSYAVTKTIEAAKKEFKDDLTNVVFELEFLGKTEVKGKPFNKFNGSYMTVEEYKEFVKGEVTVKKTNK